MKTQIEKPAAAAPDTEPEAPLVRDMLRLKPGAYWRAFMGESLLFKVACIYLMFEYVRPQTIWPVIAFLPFPFLSLVIGVGLALFSPEASRTRTFGSKHGLLALFLVQVIISILASHYPAYAWSELPVLLSWLCAYLLITKAVSNEVRMLFFYVLFLLFSFKMSQHGFLSWAASGFSFNRDGVSGAPGWFQNSGEVGIQMCIFFPMAVYFIVAGWSSWGPKLRMAALCVPLTIVGTIVGSSSRGALIGLTVVCLWMFRHSKYKFRALAALAVVGVVVALVLPPEFYVRLNSMGEDSSSSNRLEYWAWGWQKMQEHPLLGLGYSNWYPEYSAHLLQIGSTKKPEICHNIFIQAGSELGFPGLLLQIALLASTFMLNAAARKLLDSDPRNNYLRQMSLGLDAGMIGYIISAQFVTVLYYPYQWIALAMTVCLYNVVHRKMRPAGVVAGRRNSRSTAPKMNTAAPA